MKEGILLIKDQVTQSVRGITVSKGKGYQEGNEDRFVGSRRL